MASFLMLFLELALFEVPARARCLLWAAVPARREGGGLGGHHPLPRHGRLVAVERLSRGQLVAYRGQRIYTEELQSNPQFYAMMFRTSMAGDFDGMDLQSDCLIYSLWPGYLDRDRTDLREWAKHKEIDFHIVHSSGHASSADLYRMAQAVAPQRHLPIRTAHPERYVSLSANTVIAANGEWLTV